jgi:hypothetical protein
VSAERRLLHDDEAGALQMAHNTLGRDGGHVFVRIVNALSALIS